MTRWSLVVDDQTDRNLRTYLGLQSAKKGDLSKFIEQAVLDKLFNETAKAVKDRNGGVEQDVIMASINEAVREVRGADCS